MIGGDAGVVIAVTVIRVPPARARADAPYPVVAARFGDTMVVGRIESAGGDGSAPAIGARVAIAGRDEAGVRLRPLDDGAAGAA